MWRWPSLRLLSELLIPRTFRRDAGDVACIVGGCSALVEDLDSRRITAGSRIPGIGRLQQDTKGHKGGVI